MSAVALDAWHVAAWGPPSACARLQTAVPDRTAGLFRPAASCSFSELARLPSLGSGSASCSGIAVSEMAPACGSGGNCESIELDCLVLLVSSLQVAGGAARRSWRHLSSSSSRYLACHEAVGCRGTGKKVSISAGLVQERVVARTDVGISTGWSATSERPLESHEQEAVLRS